MAHAVGWTRHHTRCVGTLLTAVSVALVAAGGCGQRPTGPGAARDGAVAFEPLPDTAFRVTWAPLHVPTALKRGERCRVSVSCTNSGPVAWPADGSARRYAVRLSHRWQRGIDMVIASHYGSHRVELPGPLRPGESATLTETLVAPDEPGSYVVQFDLVQAAVGWFADHGAALKLVLVRVE